MPRLFRLFLPLLALCLLGGCSPLRQGGYTAEGYEWQVDRDTYLPGDPYCFVTAQRSQEEGTWYCFVDILEREILDITLVVPDSSIGEPLGYGYYLNETAASPFTREKELIFPDWYLTFYPNSPLFLDDPSAYFIGIQGRRNNTNLVVIPSQVAQAVDQFLLEQYGSLEGAEEAILQFWYDQYESDSFEEDIWDDLWNYGFWEDGLWDDSYSFEDVFGDDFSDDYDQFGDDSGSPLPNEDDPYQQDVPLLEKAFLTSFHPHSPCRRSCCKANGDNLWIKEWNVL